MLSWNGWRLMALILCCICLMWGILPLFTSRLQVGSIAMIAVGTLGIGITIWWPQVTAWYATTLGKGVLLTAAAVCVSVLLLFLAVSGRMIAATMKDVPENATVVVLGAGLRGDRPSRMLRQRLDAAIDYLNAHPEAVCVVSGGQGADEICTEASVMKRYLTEHGIHEQRIYTEDRSTNTQENLAFSKQVIEENGLSRAIAVVTQEYHQCRAQAFAKQQGFTQVGAIVAHTEWALLPAYWIRDFAGLCHMVVFD